MHQDTCHLSCCCVAILLSSCHLFTKGPFGSSGSEKWIFPSRWRKHNKSVEKTSLHSNPVQHSLVLNGWIVESLVPLLPIDVGLLLSPACGKYRTFCFCLYPQETNGGGESTQLLELENFLSFPINWSVIFFRSTGEEISTEWSSCFYFKKCKPTAANESFKRKCFYTSTSLLIQTALNFHYP